MKLWQGVIISALLAGCTADVPALEGRDMLVLNPLCLFICSTSVAVADTEAAGAATTTQSTTTGGLN